MAAGARRAARGRRLPEPQGTVSAIRDPHTPDARDVPPPRAHERGARRSRARPPPGHDDQRTRGAAGGARVSKLEDLRRRERLGVREHRRQGPPASFGDGGTTERGVRDVAARLERFETRRVFDTERGRRGRRDEHDVPGDRSLRVRAPRQASSPSKASNRDDARLADYEATRIRRVVSVCVSLIRAASMSAMSAIRVSSSSASMIGGSSVETGDTGVTLFRCFANARRNARVRRSRCLAPPSARARKSATRSGFSVLRFSPGSLACANTATSSSLGDAAQNRERGLDRRSGGRERRTGVDRDDRRADDAAGARLATTKSVTRDVRRVGASHTFITSALKAPRRSARLAPRRFAPERACLVSLSVSPSGSSQRTPSVTCAPPPTHGETRRTTGGTAPRDLALRDARADGHERVHVRARGRRER